MRVTANAIKKPSRYLFDLEPFFADSKWDLSDTRYFPNGTGSIAKDYPIQEIARFDDPYLDNEVRGFLQHLVVDKRTAASTTKRYIIEVFIPLSEFMNSKYPDVDSITDIPYEQISSEFFDYRKQNGAKGTTQRITLTADMSKKKSAVKSSYIYKFNGYYTYIDSIRNPVSISTEQEYEQDIWDIRRLGLGYNNNKASKRYSLNFTRITIPWLKEITKRYCYRRLPLKSIELVGTDIAAISTLNEYLSKYRPDIDSISSIMAQLSRQKIEVFIMN